MKWINKEDGLASAEASERKTSLATASRRASRRLTSLMSNNVMHSEPHTQRRAGSGPCAAVVVCKRKRRCASSDCCVRDAMHSQPKLAAIISPMMSRGATIPQTRYCFSVSYLIPVQHPAARRCRREAHTLLVGILIASEKAIGWRSSTGTSPRARDVCGLLSENASRTRRRF